MSCIKPFSAVAVLIVVGSLMFVFMSPAETAAIMPLKPAVAALAMTAAASPSLSGAFSIKAWCKFRGYSVATFYKMKRNGVAPKVTQPPGAPPRISAEADREWLEFCNNPNGEMAATAARGAEQRRERAVKAAAKSIESPKHVSNRHRAA
jgi:hypothetical protein